MRHSTLATSRTFYRSMLAPLLVIGIGVLLRLLHLATLPANPRTYLPGADEEFYIRFGMDVAQGTGGMTPEFLFMDPLYGYLLGLLFGLFGKNLFLVYLLQVLIDAATIGLIYGIGKEVWGRRAGLIAASAYGVTASVIFYSTTVLKEGLVTPYFALWVYLGLRLWRSAGTSAWPWLGYGLFLGIGVALRANLFLLAMLGLLSIPMANVLCHGKGPKVLIARVVPALMGLAVVLGLLAFRSATIGGQWTFLPTNGGVVLHQLYNTENPDAQHAVPSFVNHLLPGEIWQSYRHEAERRQGQTLPPHAVSNYWRHEAMAYLSDHLGQTLRNTLRKGVEFTAWKEVANNRALNEGEYFSWVLRLLPRPFGWLIALGLPGLILLGLRSPKGWLLLATLGLVVVTFAFFFAVDRFRLAAVPLLAVGVGITLDAVITWRSTGRRVLAGVLVGAVLLGAISLWTSRHLSEPRPEDFMHSWAWGYLNMGDLPSAEALTVLLLRQFPDNYRSYEIAGYVALAKKTPEQAVGYYEQGLKRAPQEHLLLFNRGVAWEQLGRYDQALASVEAALRVRETPEYLFRKATLLSSLGRSEPARRLFGELAVPATMAKGADWRHYGELARGQLGGP